MFIFFNIYYMDWVDRILDNISKFGIKSITKLEKTYLDNYGKEEQESLLLELNIRYDYYVSLSVYDIKNLSWIDNKFAESLTKEEISFARLNLLWDNFEAEDSIVFQKIYGIPDRILDKAWNEVPKKYKILFSKYWLEYYNISI